MFSRFVFSAPFGRGIARVLSLSFYQRNVLVIWSRHIGCLEIWSGNIVDVLIRSRNDLYLVIWRGYILCFDIWSGNIALVIGGWGNVLRVGFLKSWQLCFSMNIDLYFDGKRRCRRPCCQRSWWYRRACRRRRGARINLMRCLTNALWWRDLYVQRRQHSTAQWFRSIRFGLFGVIWETTGRHGWGSKLPVWRGLLESGWYKVQFFWTFFLRKWCVYVKIHSKTKTEYGLENSLVIAGNGSLFSRIEFFNRRKLDQSEARVKQRQVGWKMRNQYFSKLYSHWLLTTESRVRSAGAAPPSTLDIASNITWLHQFSTNY